MLSVDPALLLFSRTALFETALVLFMYGGMFLLLTGARKQEALRAAWDDFDFQRGFWLIPETKSGRPRAVPLSDHVLQLLSDLPSRGQSPWLFPNPKTGNH